MEAYERDVAKTLTVCLRVTAPFAIHPRMNLNGFVPLIRIDAGGSTDLTTTMHSGMFDRAGTCTVTAILVRNKRELARSPAVTIDIIGVDHPGSASALPADPGLHSPTTKRAG